MFTLIIEFKRRDVVTVRVHVFEFLTRRISCKAINILRSIGHLYANNGSTASENHISVLIISDLWIRGRWQLSNIRLMQEFTGFSDLKMNKQYCVCVCQIFTWTGRDMKCLTLNGSCLYCCPFWKLNLKIYPLFI